MTATWHASYTTGPVSFGYQTGGWDNGLETSSVATTTAATIAAAAVHLNSKKCQLRLT